MTTTSGDVTWSKPADAISWQRPVSSVTGLASAATNTAGMAGSHPLAKRIGAWPSVAVVTAVAVAAAELVTRTAATGTAAGR